MTDETPTVPAAIVCGRHGCHVLVPDTLEDRREHRQGHDHDDKVEEAIRRALRELRSDFDKLRGTVRDEMKTIREEVSGIDRAVGQIEIPEQRPPLEIRRGGWDDDDDATDPSDVDDEDWGFAKPDPSLNTPAAATSAQQADENPDPAPDAHPDPIDPQAGAQDVTDLRPTWVR